MAKEISMTDNQVADWFATAAPGARFAYHTGKRITDSDLAITSGTLHAKRLWNAGLVDFVQRRISHSVGNIPGEFEFLCIKRAVPQLIPRDQMMDLNGFNVIGEDSPRKAA